MVFSKSSSIPTCRIKVHPPKHLDQLNFFVYLGSVFTSDGKCNKKLKRPIAITKTASHLWRKHCAGETSVFRFGWEYWNSIFGQLCNTDVKHGHWAKGWSKTWRQQNTGFSEECWEYPGLIMSAHVRCSVELVYENDLCRTWFEDKWHFLAM